MTRRRAALQSLALGVIVAPLLTTVPAAAAAPACPTRATERTPITWGAPGPLHALGDSDRAAGIALSGLARGGNHHPPSIRTRRAPDGTGHPVLCTDGRLRARLPRLRRGVEIHAASVNGAHVAWRETRPGSRGVIVRAEVRGARLRGVRRLSVPIVTSDPKVDRGLIAERDEHRIVAHANGTIGWTLSAATTDSVTRTWVWPRNGPVRRTGRHRVGDGHAMRIIDDENVLLSGSTTPLRYAPATPGRCPELTDGEWRDLGGWRLADVSGSAVSNDDGTGLESWTGVCNPVTGRYIDVVANSVYAFRGDSNRRTATHAVRSGDLLLISTHGFYAYPGDATWITDTRSGRKFVAFGRVEGSAIDHADEMVPQDPPLTAAVTSPGATAFLATQTRGDAVRQTLWLDDAVGTRALATADIPATGAPANDTGLANLELRPSELRWTAAGAPRTIPVTPRSGSPFAVVRPVIASPLREYFGPSARLTGGRR